MHCKCQLKSLTWRLAVTYIVEREKILEPSFDVCIHFGRTEYRAFLEWVEGVSLILGVF